MKAAHISNTRGDKKPVTPKLLRFWIGGFGGSDFELEWDGARLRRRSSEAPRGWPPESQSWEDLPTPEQTQWIELTQALEEVGAWTWPAYSNDPDVMDGTQWSLKIRWGSRRRSVGGSNAFPPGFDRIEHLLKLLTGERIEG